MVLKLAKEFKIGIFRKLIIYSYMVTMTCLLGISIYYNIVAFINGEEVVG